MAIQRCRENIGGLVESFPQRCSVTDCRDLNICQASVVQLENALLNDLFSFYFRSALLTKPNDQVSYHPEMDAFGLFISRAGGNSSDNKCQFWETKPLGLRDAFSSLKIHDHSPSPREDWRTGMSETLERSSRAMHDYMVQKVQDICYDLEKRCNGVEAPLRAVEEERNRLSREAREVKSRNEELHLDRERASEVLCELQANMSDLEAQAQSASDRVNELSANLEAARKELDDQRIESQESANSEREQARSRELDLIASLTEKEEQLEDLQDQVRGAREENRELTKTLEMMTKENAFNLETKTTLEKEMSNLRSEMESQMQEAQNLISQMETGHELLLHTTKEEAKGREEALQSRVSPELS